MRALLLAIGIIVAGHAQAREVHVKNGAYTCSNSLVFKQFDQLETMSKREYNKLLDGGNCFPASDQTSFTLVKEYGDSVLVTLSLGNDGMAASFIRRSDLLSQP